MHEVHIMQTLKPQSISLTLATSHRLCLNAYYPKLEFR